MVDVEENLLFGAVICGAKLSKKQREENTLSQIEVRDDQNLVGNWHVFKWDDDSCTYKNRFLFKN